MRHQHELEVCSVFFFGFDAETKDIIPWSFASEREPQNHPLQHQDPASVPRIEPESKLRDGTCVPDCTWNPDMTPVLISEKTMNKLFDILDGWWMLVVQKQSLLKIYVHRPRSTRAPVHETCDSCPQVAGKRPRSPRRRPVLLAFSGPGRRRSRRSWTGHPLPTPVEDQNGGPVDERWVWSRKWTDESFGVYISSMV